MTATDTSVEDDWARLADVEEAEREPLMQERYIELAGLSEVERRNRLKAMVQPEHALPQDKLRSFIVSTLRVWLRMDPESAQRVASSYDAVVNQMPGAEAMRRFGLVQSVVRQFPPEEQERLRAVIPRVLSSQPRHSGPRLQRASAKPAAPHPRRRKRPWWAFWKR